MARYTTRVEADKAKYPVLLSNGNLKETGELEGGRHFAVWEVCPAARLFGGCLVARVVCVCGVAERRARGVHATKGDGQHRASHPAPASVLPATPTPTPTPTNTRRTRSRSPATCLRWSRATWWSRRTPTPPAAGVT
jgi:hypothetical protein